MAFGWFSRGSEASVWVDGLYALWIPSLSFAFGSLGTVPKSYTFFSWGFELTGCVTVLSEAGGALPGLVSYISTRIRPKSRFSLRCHELED